MNNTHENKKELSSLKIRQSKEFKQAKKRCDEAVRQNGSYSFNIISLALSGLKEALGERAVYVLATDFPVINKFVVVPGINYKEDKYDT